MSSAATLAMVHKKSSFPGSSWKDEMNFCEYPLSVLGDRPPKDVTSLTYEVSAAHGSHGEEKRTLTIIPPSDEQLTEILKASCPWLLKEERQGTVKRRSRKKAVVPNGSTNQSTLSLFTPKGEVLFGKVRGVPTANDDDVVLALIELTRRVSNFAEDGRQVHFSLYELVKLLGWNQSSRSYQRLVASLLRWKAVTLTYTNAWREKGTDAKAYKTTTFNLLSEVTIFWGERTGQRAEGQGGLPFSSFIWHETVYKSFRDGFLKNLDFDTYSSLRSMTAKRMYRFLDKHFTLAEKYQHRDPAVTFDLVDFARGHIGLLCTDEPWKIKQKLAGAIAELEDKGIIVRCSEDKRYLRKGRGHWLIAFRKSDVAATAPVDAPAAQAAKPPLDRDQEATVGQLVLRGLTEATAQEIVRQHPIPRVTDKIEYLDFLIERGKSPDDPPAWLFTAIRKDFKAPQGFETKAQRERKQQDNARRRQEREETKRRQEEHRREEKRREEAARDARLQHVDDYLASLTAEEREALEQRAFASADAGRRQFVRKEGVIGNAIRRKLMEEEVLRVHPMPDTSKE